MSKATRVILVLGTVVLIAMLLGTCAQRSSSRTALARYKSELRAKGEKFTLADFGYPRKPEPGRSFDLLLSNANLLASQKFQPGLLELLGFIEPGKARVCWRMPQPPLNSSWSTRSNALTWEEFSKEFVVAADALKAIREATRNPPRYFYCDPTNWANQPKSPFVGMRIAAQWLSGEAIAALHAGQPRRAQANLHALTQLAQFNRDDLWLVSQMIRVAIAGLALDLTWEALQAEGWSEESLAALQKDWEALELLEAAQKGMLGERASGEAAFSHMRSISAKDRARFVRLGGSAGGSWNDYLDAWVWMPLWKANSYDDEMLFMEHYQHFLDALRRLQKGLPWQEVDRELQSKAAELDNAISHPFARLRYRFSAIAIPNGARAASTCVRNETRRRLTVTAIALERYKLRHGTPPSELAALVPQFLSAVPLDPMSGKPLRYRLNTGGFVLYSVGEDGRDDDGDPSSPSATNKFDLWAGKDAVWPSPAR
jgi:hypothetical protein